MGERRLTSALADARDELYDIEKCIKSGMMGDPEEVVATMVKEINELRNDVIEAGNLSFDAIKELQRIQCIAYAMDEPVKRPIGVALKELEEKFHKIHDRWSE